MNSDHDNTIALQSNKVFGLNFEEFASHIRELWGDEYFRAAVERRINNAKGVERAGALLIKELALEAGE